MNYWIFQSIPERNDLRETLREGNEETWLISRYWQQMSPGDLVFFWLGGPPTIRGVYGWGTLTTTPAADSDKEYGARLRCDKRLSPHVPVKRIRAVRKLKDIAILHQPQATNFILSREEAQAISELIAPAERPLIPPIPAELVDAIRSRECVLFAGAGLSARSGVPTWNQFLSDLLTFAKDQQIIDPSEVISLKAALKEGARNAAADGLVHGFGSRREILEGFLLKTFPPKKGLSPSHHLLTQIPFAAVVTTNYDDLLEETFPEFAAAGLYTPKDAEALLDALSQRRPFILKLYGILQRSATLILAPIEYQEVVSSNVSFSKFVEGLFFSRSFFFIGLSLEGIEDFLSGFVFRGAIPRKHFALVATSGTAWKAKADFLERRFNVRVIDYPVSESFPEFDTFVEALQKATTPLISVTAPRSSEVPTPGIRRIFLEDIGSFEKLELDFARNMWKILLGDNGVGKSTILKAIGVAIIGSDARTYAGRLVRAGKTRGRITLFTERNPHGYITEILTKDMLSDAEVVSIPSRCMEAEGWLALGFSPFRMVTWTPSTGPQQIVQKGRPSADDLIALLSGEADPHIDRLKQWIVNLDAADRPRQMVSLEGHKGRVSSLAFTSDGRTLVSASIDKTIRVWDSWVGVEKRKIDAHGAGVNAIAIGGSDKVMVSGSFDRTAKSWEMESGRLLKSFHGSQSQILSLSISPDGALLASGSEGGSIRLWDCSSASELKHIVGHSGSVWSVAIGLNGKTVVGAFQDGVIRTYEVESGRELSSIKATRGAVWSIALTADGRTLVSGTDSGSVAVWDVVSGRKVRTLQDKEPGALSVAISADGQIAASGAEDGTVTAWNVSSGREILSLQGHSSGVWAVALTADGHLLASGSNDSTIKIWSVPTATSTQQQYTTIKKLFEVIATLTDREDIEFLRVTENYRVFVKLAEAPQGVPLELLSQGLTSLLGWVGFLCQRLKETAQESTTEPIPTNRFALVLVDELDAHMHPRWQQVLVRRLKQVFPNIQFIASTHSPLIVEGLDACEVDRFVMENGKISVVDVSQEMTVGRADQILTSPLFGLTSARGQRSRELLDRYANLAAKDELTADETKEFEQLSRVLRVGVPTDQEQATASQVFNMIQEALQEKLGEMNEGDREKIMRELKVRSKEIATGSARDL